MFLKHWVNVVDMPVIRLVASRVTGPGTTKDRSPESCKFLKYHFSKFPCRFIVQTLSLTVSTESKNNVSEMTWREKKSHFLFSYRKHKPALKCEHPGLCSFLRYFHIPIPAFKEKIHNFVVKVQMPGITLKALRKTHTLTHTHTT